MDHNFFMQRCLQLAALGSGNVAPNPMVGSVIVHNGEIIGEGYHQEYGGPHAEVNAIQSVADPSLLKASTLYVNLEPCAHFGKTPPCSDLIIEHKIPHVVIGAVDDNQLVAGKGITKLKNEGIKVEVNVLKEKCLALNKRFYKAHTQQLPYVFLKWARTQDGFISKTLINGKAPENNWITGKESKLFVHQMRSEEQAILIGKNTAVLDNPSLTTRLVEGKSPLRVILCHSTLDLENLKVLTDNQPTLIFNNERSNLSGNKEWIKFNGDLKEVLQELVKRDIHSLIVEGGSTILNQFIDEQLWDEAFELVGPISFGTGKESPSIDSSFKKHQIKLGNDTVNHFIR